MHQQARKFFKSILAPDSCLHSLLPAPRDKNLKRDFELLEHSQPWLLVQNVTNLL